jgi:hypothetical protein
MGTRSLTLVKDENEQTIINLYRQYDGYPSGHGQELADFLQKGKLVNGLSGNETNLFNGMGCLAAQLVALLKTEAGCIYLYPAEARDCGEEYIYTIFPKDGKIWLRVESGCMTAFGLPGTKQENMNVLFEKPVSEFTVAACELVEKSQEPPPNDFIEAHAS